MVAPCHRRVFTGNKPSAARCFDRRATGGDDPAASARGFGGGGFRGGGFYGGGYGLGFYPGFHGGWYGPWNGPGYYTPNAGEVQISTKHKGDQIFVDGGLAGRTAELKKFPLRPGARTIKLRNAIGQTFYQEKINVIAGKKLKIQSDYVG
jgi:hypothetical protein